MTVVVFDYAAWSARYPELAASVDAPTALLYFNEAGLYCSNTDESPIQDVTRRGLILNMLTAHIVALNAQLNGQESSPLVGRIASAGEGSVNVQAVFDVPGSAAWFASSKYGAAAWQAMLPYRTARYLSSPGMSYCRPWARW